MENPETVAIFGTQDTDRRQTKLHKTQTEDKRNYTTQRPARRGALLVSIGTSTVG